MSGDYLLDTNILIPLTEEEDEIVRLVRLASSISVPFIALAELHFGALNSSQVRRNLDRVEVIAHRFFTVFPDHGTIGLYGKVRLLLQSHGCPIPEADLWIAALAIQHDLTLVSRDVHFTAIEGLRLERW